MKSNAFNLMKTFILDIKIPTIHWFDTFVRVKFFDNPLNDVCGIYGCRWKCEFFSIMFVSFKHIRYCSFGLLRGSNIYIIIPSIH